MIKPKLSRPSGNPRATSARRASVKSLLLLNARWSCLRSWSCFKATLNLLRTSTFSGSCMNFGHPAMANSARSMAFTREYSGWSGSGSKSKSSRLRLVIAFMIRFLSTSWDAEASLMSRRMASSKSSIGKASSRSTLRSHAQSFPCHLISSWSRCVTPSVRTTTELPSTCVTTSLNKRVALGLSGAIATASSKQHQLRCKGVALLSRMSAKPSHC
mmetsp:Transcript_123376/g.348623  ORF Transcript_123376/g.348623 Transcript_123376/m.348623 type:complete len:215 (+) Transcript_123376:1494-2138(+)